MGKLENVGVQARQAARKLVGCSTAQINRSLAEIADRLWARRQGILAANQTDAEQAKRDHLQPALIDRLTLSERKLEGVLADLHKVSDLPDPVGEIFDSTILANGLKVHKLRVPLGVLGVIYESRPNVTVDVAGLALKTHNCAILRGGSETLNTNRILVETIRQVLHANGMPVDAIQFVDDPDRELVREMLQMDAYIDLIIPRGSNTLQQFCRDNSRIPVVYGGIGICHLFVDQSADLEASLRVIRNAKIQAPSVCNALDVVLVHQAVAEEFIPRLLSYLEGDGVIFRLDERAMRLLPAAHPPLVQPAAPPDFDTEWLSLVLSVKIVDSLDEAIEHITLHSTHHSDGILTQDDSNVARFVAEVDSAAVYVNASTRFTDGAQLGLGTEVAISTQRTHARGPVGLRELTTYKWVIAGDYSVRA